MAIRQAHIYPRGNEWRFFFKIFERPITIRESYRTWVRGISLSKGGALLEKLLSGKGNFMTRVKRHLLELSLLVAALATAIAAFMPIRADAGEKRMTMTHRWEVEANYPGFGDEAVDEAVVNWLNREIADVMDSVKDGADVSYIEEGNAFSLYIDYQTYSPSDRALSVLFSVVRMHHRAVHPVTTLGSVNILAGASSPLGLDDLFADPAKALEILSKNAKPLVREYYANEVPGLTEEALTDLVENAWFDGGSAPVRDNYSVLTLARDGVRVHFMQYQIGPYVIGSSEFVVTLDKLAPAGPNPEVWPEAGSKG